MVNDVVKSLHSAALACVVIVTNPPAALSYDDFLNGRMCLASGGEAVEDLLVRFYNKRVKFVLYRSNCMALETVVTQRMGPERICPNEHEELGLQEPSDGILDPVGEWSSEEPEEEEEEEGINNGYVYQPLNQEPDQGPTTHELTATSTEPALDINQRLQAMRLHLPDPPIESDNEEEERLVAQSSHNSIPMDPEHVELVKRTMAGIKLPTLSIPAWANEISDEQWQDMVQRTLQDRQSQNGFKPEWK